MEELEARELQKEGYSAEAIAMHFGPVGSTEYYESKKKYGGDVSGKCPRCGEICFGTGDCNCGDE